MLVKKYANRRLYDTERSAYITLDELAEAIKEGAEPKVVDAKSGDDITQGVLAQIILESRGASRLLPVPLLMQLIRMGDDALSEFFGGYMGWALGVYLQAKQQARAMANFNPFGGGFSPPGFNAPGFFGGGAPPWYGQGMQPPPVSPQPEPPQAQKPEPEPEPEPQPETEPEPTSGEDTTRNELDALRREIDALKASLGGGD